MKLKVFTLTLLLLAIAPLAANAQQVSAGRFDALREAQDTGECRTQSTLLNARLIAVEQLIATVLNCNQNGQVYDQNAGNCATPDLSPEHSFLQPDEGATLSFRNPNNAFGDVAVVGGAKGADIECAEDSGPVDDGTDPPTGSDPVCGPATSCAAGYGLVGNETNACLVGAYSDPGGTWCGTGCCWNCGTLRCRRNVDTCFTAGTKVRLADGAVKNIEAIQAGDVVRGMDGQENMVEEVLVHKLQNKKLYAFNGGDFFVTADHPFMTTTGWKAISPTMTQQRNPGFVDENGLPETLAEGDVLVLENGAQEVLHSLEGRDRYGADTPVYNLRVSGNSTYFANGYLVHNK